MTDQQYAAQRYLSQLFYLKQDQRRAKEQIDDLTIRAGYGTGKRFAKNMSGTDRRCPMEDCILNKLEVLDALEEILAKYDALEREIRRVIETVPREYKSILLMRYVLFKRFEQIGVDMGWNMLRVHETHGAALECVKVPETTKYSV